MTSAASSARPARGLGAVGAEFGRRRAIEQADDGALLMTEARRSEPAAMAADAPHQHLLAGEILHSQRFMRNQNRVTTAESTISTSAKG